MSVYRLQSEIVKLTWKSPIALYNFNFWVARLARLFCVPLACFAQYLFAFGQCKASVPEYMSSSPLSRANAEAHRITWAEVANFVNRNP